MRGSIKRRGPSWAIVIDMGLVTDPTTGEQKRKQKRITFRGTKPEAEAHLNKLLTRVSEGTYIDKSKDHCG